MFMGITCCITIIKVSKRNEYSSCNTQSIGCQAKLTLNHQVELLHIVSVRPPVYLNSILMFFLAFRYTLTHMDLIVALATQATRQQCDSHGRKLQKHSP